MKKALSETPIQVVNRINMFVEQASTDAPICLHMNEDALVVEFNDVRTGVKCWEIIAHVAENNS